MQSSTDPPTQAEAACTSSRPSIVRHSIVRIGIPLSATLALGDSYALRAVVGQHDGRLVYTVYGLFVLQIAVVSAIVGYRVNREWVWWGISAWTILLIDLQVFSLAAPNRDSDVVKKLGFAIASSQIGILVCIGVLGELSWRLRLPLVGIGLALAFMFSFSLNGRSTWYLLQMLQSIATCVTCFVLRWIGFRIAKVDDELLAKQSAMMQFSIRHLFYWTTGVACIVAVGRMIGWRALLGAGTELGRTPELMLYVPLLTLVSIVAMWGAIGREPWWLRIFVLLCMLPGVGSVLGLSTRWSRSRWDNPFYIWNGSLSEVVTLGIIWASLVGALLAGLLLAFRLSNHRLQRVSCIGGT